LKSIGLKLSIALFTLPVTISYFTSNLVFKEIILF